MTRTRKQQLCANGFGRVPICNIARDLNLEKILITKESSKVIDRRYSSGAALAKSPARCIPPVPQLIPLRSALKQPTRAPINIRGRQRRQSMFVARTISPISPFASSSGYVAPTASTPQPTLPKGTTKNIVMNRLNVLPDQSQSSQSVNIASSDVDSDFGELRMSNSDTE